MTDDELDQIKEWAQDRDERYAAMLITELRVTRIMHEGTKAALAIMTDKYDALTTMHSEEMSKLIVERDKLRAEVEHLRKRCHSGAFYFDRNYQVRCVDCDAEVVNGDD